jgi:hypothetical protein
MISLASSFQRCQPHPVSITLAPTNHRPTFASTSFQWTFRRAFPEKPCTSNTNGHHHRVYLVELNAVVWWIARFRCRLRHLPQLRRAFPSPSFLPGRRWAHYHVHLIDLVPFCCSRAHFEDIPIKSIPFIISLYVLFTVTVANSICKSSCSTDRNLQP